MLRSTPRFGSAATINRLAALAAGVKDPESAMSVSSSSSASLVELPMHGVAAPAHIQHFPEKIKLTGRCFRDILSNPAVTKDAAVGDVRLRCRYFAESSVDDALLDDDQQKQQQDLMSFEDKGPKLRAGNLRRNGPIIRRKWNMRHEDASFSSVDDIGGRLQEFDGYAVEKFYGGGRRLAMIPGGMILVDVFSPLPARFAAAGGRNAFCWVKLQKLETGLSFGDLTFRSGDEAQTDMRALADFVSELRAHSVFRMRDTRTKNNGSGVGAGNTLPVSYEMRYVAAKNDAGRVHPSWLGETWKRNGNLSKKIGGGFGKGKKKGLF